MKFLVLFITVMLISALMTNVDAGEKWKKNKDPAESSKSRFFYNFRTRRNSSDTKRPQRSKEFADCHFKCTLLDFPSMQLCLQLCEDEAKRKEITRRYKQTTKRF